MVIKNYKNVKIKIIISTVCFIFFWIPVGAQNKKQIKKLYNDTSYYSIGKIKSIGNYSDSLRQGQWKFYKPDGTILAIGNFKQGVAKGKWIYYDYDGVERIYKWNWRKGFKPKTILEIRDDNLYILQNTFFSNGVFRHFANGKYIGGGKL